MTPRRKTATVCNTPGCPNLTPCPEHKRTPWAGSTRRATLPPNWPAIRRQVLARDGHRCRHCGTDERLEVDHIGDRNDHQLDNLQTLCAGCHLSKTTEQAAQARKKNPHG